MGRLAPARDLAQSSDAEVEDLERPVSQDEEIGRLDVSMNDPFGVRSREHFEKLVRNREHGFARKPTLVPVQNLVEGQTVEQLHDEKRSAVLRQVVVEYGDRAGVADGVRGVSFTQEAPANVVLARELDVEHLQRETHLISVGDLVNDGHAARAEHTIQAVLAVQDVAYARLRARRGLLPAAHIPRTIYLNRYSPSPSPSLYRARCACLD
jgi:hypothetical protein